MENETVTYEDIIEARRELARLERKWAQSQGDLIQLNVRCQLALGEEFVAVLPKGNGRFDIVTCFRKRLSDLEEQGILNRFRVGREATFDDLSLLKAAGIFQGHMYSVAGGKVVNYLLEEPVWDIPSNQIHLFRMLRTPLRLQTFTK